MMPPCVLVNKGVC